MKEFIDLIKKIQVYQPYNELERLDKETILSLLQDPIILTRDQKTYHITASCWVINESKDKVLMIYHKIYQSWSWLGGHADGDPNLYEVAKKELFEESGIDQYLKSENSIFSIEILPVMFHKKKGVDISSHLHLNVTYLFIVDENAPRVLNEEETEGLAWIAINEIDELVSEPEMKLIYQKLISKQ